MKIRTKTLYSLSFLGLLTLIFFIVLPVARGQVPEPGDPPTISNKAVKNGTAMSNGDPIHMGIGELYFTRTLANLGGPLPLVLDLYYGSLSSLAKPILRGGLVSDALTLKFFSNHRLILEHLRDLDWITLFGELGEQRNFLFDGNQWNDQFGRQKFQLKSTADYYYFADPRSRRVMIFKRRPASDTGSEAIAFLLLYELRDIWRDLPDPPEIADPYNSVDDGL